MELSDYEVLCMIDDKVDHAKYIGKKLRKSKEYDKEMQIRMLDDLYGANQFINKFLKIHQYKPDATTSV